MDLADPLCVPRQSPVTLGIAGYSTMASFLASSVSRLLIFAYLVNAEVGLDRATIILNAPFA